MVTVGGAHPRRTIDELISLAEGGFGLDLVLPAGFDLHELAPVLAVVRTLHLGAQGDLVGWDALEAAENLADFLSWVPITTAVDLGLLPSLLSLTAEGPFAITAAGSATLQMLSISVPSWPSR